MKIGFIVRGGAREPFGSVSFVERLRAFVLALLASAACGVHAETLADRLNTPSRISAKAEHGVFNALAYAGTQLVGAGQRGHILRSGDDGKTWTQSPVPVGSDLTALQFVDARNGWAVGHDGVILHSADGGQSWTLQLDGWRIAELLKTHAASLDPARAADAIGELERAAEQGVDQSLLGLHFSDASHGFVVGANNLVLATDDGGEHWQPWSDRMENPMSLHLYGVGEAFGRVFIVGEQGLILRRSEDGERFEALESPYQGSWFGLLGATDRLLVHGLRGNAWVSRDAGATWQRAELDSAVAIAAADATESGELLLAGLGGEVFRSRDGGLHFQSMPLAQRFPFAALAVSGNARLALAGTRGLRVVPLEAQ